MPSLLRPSVLCLVVLAMSALAGTAQSPPPPLREVEVHLLPWERRPLTIPMQEAGASGLEAWLFAPRTSGKHPLLLMENGWGQIPYDGPKECGPGVLVPEALWFVRRGWAVGMVLRRGFGRSGGEITEKDLSKTRASQQSFEWLQTENAKDLHAAYDFLSTQPDVDGTRTVVAGFWNAGSAAMWFAKDPPPGLIAVLNFSGGWNTTPDWMLKGKVHVIPDVLVPVFTGLGATTRTPMLWLYPSKGSGFGLKSAQVSKDAFTAAGGDAQMHVLKNSGDKDRFLFGMDPAEWGPLVEQFLTKLNLPAAEVVVQHEPTSKELPASLTDSQKDGYRRYLRRGPAKAFAGSPRGAWAYSSGLGSLKLAEKRALLNCGNQDCKVIASED